MSEGAVTVDPERASCLRGVCWGRAAGQLRRYCTLILHRSTVLRCGT